MNTTNFVDFVYSTMATICKSCIRNRLLSTALRTSGTKAYWTVRLAHSDPPSATSTLPFYSDRDPEAAEKIPVHKYVGERHKRNMMLYVCGLGETGALGVIQVHSKSGKVRRAQGNFRFPARLPMVGDLGISTVDCGYGFTVFGSNQKDVIKVWGTGINTDSQLGFHSSRDKSMDETTNKAGYYDFMMEPAPIPLPLKDFSKTRVLQVACGRAHTLVLTDEEGIFTFGNNAFGQCGRRIIEGELYSGSRKIHQIPHKIFSSRVKQVVCGMDHSLFLTEKGKVYGCGWGADGQTGIGSFERTGTPTLLKGDLEGVKIKQISTFADMCLAVCEDGQVYGWGNSEYYQLSSVTDETQVCEPRRLPFKKIGKVSNAAAGGSMCAVANEAGEVWVWGYGILGKGPQITDARYPTRIPQTLFGESPFNPDVKVKKVKCGLNHFAAVTNRGELFTWGKNTAGCLGIGVTDNRYFPWKVLVAGAIQDVHCGVDHMVIISKSML